MTPAEAQAWIDRELLSLAGCPPHDWEPFGCCPECGHREYVNIRRDHWFFCPTHRVRWYVGSNLFSSWLYETVELWQENAEMIEPYDEIDSGTQCKQCGLSVSAEEFERTWRPQIESETETTGDDEVPF